MPLNDQKETRYVYISHPTGESMRSAILRRLY